MFVRHTRGGGNGTARWTYLMAAVRAGAGGGLMGSFTHSFTEQALQSLVLGPGKGTELTRSFPLLYGILFPFLQERDGRNQPRCEGYKKTSC